MKNIYFESPINFMEQPLQKLIELNVKTFQQMSSIKPDDLLNLKKPTDLFEKNMRVFVQNSHMMLDYMQGAFAILEEHWFKGALNTKENTKVMAKQATASIKKAVKNSASAAQSVVTKAAKTGAKTSTKVTKKSINTAKSRDHHNDFKTQPSKSSADKMHTHISSKEVGHHMPTADGLNEKSGVKNLDVPIIKGSNLTN